MAKRERPGPLTAIALVAVLLGGIGCCVGASSIASQAGQGALNDLQRAQLEAQSGGDREQVRRQLELQERMQEATEAYRPFGIAQQVLNLLVSFALLAGGILLFRWHPKAPAAFTGAAFANLAVDLAGAGLAIFTTLATRDAMEQLMRESATVDPGAPEGTEQVMGAVAQASIGMGVCTAAALFAVKAVFYVWGLVYLRKQETRRLFEQSASSPSAPAA